MFMIKKFLIILIVIICTVSQANAIEEIKLEPPEEKTWLLKAKEFHKKGLTKKFESGIMKQIMLRYGYQGSVIFNTMSNSSSTDTDYKWGVGDVMLRAKFRNDGLFVFQANTARYSSRYRRFYNKLSDFYYLTPKFFNHRLLIGQNRTPIGWEGGSSQYTLLLANRAMIARNFGNTRPLGLWLLADWGLVDYDLGVFDSGRLLEDVGEGAEFVGWLNIKPLNNISEKYGDLKIGGGVHAGSRENSYNVLLSGIQYEYKKFLINAEYAIANGYNGNSISANKAQGMYTTLAYHVTPKFKLVARYDCFDPNRRNSQDLNQEYSVGFNYFFVEQTFKAVVNFIKGINGAGADYNKFILMTQILF